MPRVTSLSPADDTVVIRLAVPADGPQLARLAALDSAPRPLRGALLVAESDGALRAALSLEDRRVIADPFAPTAGFVALLRTRAQLLRDGLPAAQSRRGAALLRRRVGVPAALR